MSFQTEEFCDNALSSANHVVASSSPTTKRQTVYVVVGCNDLMQQIGDLAGGMGLHVVPYPSAGEFLSRYDGGSGCLVTQIELPGLSGLELQRALLDMQIMLPVVFVSSRPTTAQTVQAMRNGAVTVLDAPVDSQALGNAVRDAMAIDESNRRQTATMNDIRRRLGRLTASEYAVLERMLRGLPNKSIASQLGLSLRSIESRRRRVFDKLGADSVAELVRKVLSIHPHVGELSRGQPH